MEIRNANKKWNVKRGKLMNKKKVKILMAEGFEEIEALTVVDLLRRANITVDMVSISTKEMVMGGHGILVKTDELLDHMDSTDTDMLVLPGGMPGTVNLESSEQVSTLLHKFYNENKGIAAICAAPRILGELGFLKEKKACCYPGNEAKLLGAIVTEREVEVSENIITSRGAGTAIAFALAMITFLIGKDTAEELGEKIIYQK